MFNWIKRPGRRRRPPDPETMQKLLRMVARTEQNEISCDDVYAVLDQFAEAVKRGEDLLPFMPLVRQHLEMCPDCREEYEAILLMLQPAG
jgi:predicted component of type VI protein secretion system